MIIIKSEDPIHGAVTKSFNTREEAAAYMDSIGMVKTAKLPISIEEHEPVKEPKQQKKTKPAAKPVSKPSKAKKR